MRLAIKTKLLFAIILLEIVIIGIFIIYPKLFKLETQIEFSANPQQIVFSFNQPVIKSSFEKSFQINPEAKGDFVWSDYNRSVIFKPYLLTYDLDYSVSIKNIRSYALTLLPKKTAKFRIESPSSVNFANLTKINPSKLPVSEKNIFTKPDGITIELSTPQIIEGKYIDIDISDQIMTTYQNGQIVGIYEVSTGRYGMPTPLGKFNIISKKENLWSSKYKLYMPFSMGFISGYYIHELPYWPGGYREGANHLGTRVSHGCIRLGIGPAEKVYNFTDINTPVVVHQ